MPSDRVVVIGKETVLTLGFWLKVCFTLGFYLFSWLGKSLTVTETRVIWRKGLIAKDERSVPLEKVQDVRVSYGISGRIFGYGTIRIETAGSSGTEILAKNITKAGKIRDAILNRNA